MFRRLRENYEEQLRMERERLNNMSEKELLVELVMELKKIDRKCDDIARKIVVSTMPILIIVRIALVCVIVLIGPVSIVVRIMLICIVIKLCLIVCVTGYTMSFWHFLFLPQSCLYISYSFLDPLIRTAIYLLPFAFQ